MPKDRITQAHQGYGFIEFMGEDDADYAIKVMNMIKLYGKPIRVNKVCLLRFWLRVKHLFVYTRTYLSTYVFVAQVLLSATRPN